MRNHSPKTNYVQRPESCSSNMFLHYEYRNLICCCVGTEVRLHFLDFLLCQSPSNTKATQAHRTSLPEAEKRLEACQLRVTVLKHRQPHGSVSPLSSSSTQLVKKLCTSVAPACGGGPLGKKTGFCRTFTLLLCLV